MEHAFLHVKPNTYLHNAVENDNREDIEFLLDMRSNANEADMQGVKPLHLAAYRGDIEIMELLFNRGADIHSIDYRKTPLYYAVINDSIEAIKWLLDRGADINAQDSHEKTPLYHAAILKKMMWPRFWLQMEPN